jgi:hypothetical protein
LELGPTGFPFEKFIGEILNYQGLALFMSLSTVISSYQCTDIEETD